MQETIENVAAMTMAVNRAGRYNFITWEMLYFWKLFFRELDMKKHKVVFFKSLPLQP